MRAERCRIQGVRDRDPLLGTVRPRGVGVAVPAVSVSRSRSVVTGDQVQLPFQGHRLGPVSRPDVGAERKSPIRAEPKFLTLVLPLEARRAVPLARSTEREAVLGCTDGRPGCC